MIKLRHLKCLFFTTIIALSTFYSYAEAVDVEESNRVFINVPPSASARVLFGVKKLSHVLKANQYELALMAKQKTTIEISIASEFDSKLPKEGYRIQRTGNKISLSGHDDSGLLYAFMDLADKISAQGKIPQQLNLSDHPEMVLRGTCIGVQKPTLLPGRGTYEYPYTPELFPWLYDKDLWIKYLDMMVDNRYNSLYLWNGHPFSSLVKLKEYPEALEVDEITFKRNEEMFAFITQEADKRGIWVIQMFYNIIIPKPFADKRGLATQDRNRPIVPVIADYSRKSIAAFVAKYPNVGLLVTLGEAMEGVGQMDIDWFTQTILPGVKDGLKELGTTEEPPVVLRAHDTDAPAVMKAALPIYKNLYTMAKYNGEALTTYTPRGKWADLHRTLSRIGTVQIENVHILANLEPFRYSSPDFIQKSVQAMHSVYEANGLHLYPQASYWDWPYTADKADKRLLQVDRDWMWYKAWARYAWKADRPKSDEEIYWSKLLSQEYGTNIKASESILKAYEETGEISPKLLRRVGITDGNRQTLTLGMLMTQLINPFRYGLFTLMYESEAPEGEMIIDYAKKEFNKEAHIGETPIQVANEVEKHGEIAVKAINLAADGVTQNKEEFNRLKNDIYCYDAMARFYANKTRAAVQVLKFKYTDDIADLERAVPLLEKSVKDWVELTQLTKNTYLYANSMQTKQRKIPMRGVDATFIHWEEMLPVYQKELADFKNHIDSLKKTSKGGVVTVNAFQNASVKFNTKNLSFYKLEEGSKIGVEETTEITQLAPELKGLNAIKFVKSDQIMKGTSVSFENSKPVKVLVAYFKDTQTGDLAPPILETDASANDFGQAEIKIANAIKTNDGRLLNVHSYTFPAGKNTLSLGKGAVLVLGFINDDEPLRIHNAGFDGTGKDIDWLFE
ncbi:glycoside hydrolase family 20 zincin-like fold domain-containing protein [Pedobacter alpinus]|uniref:Glycoside hydrolase family 20 zincin-like fold domain-containing protein n=1 Tax=Pedobacter alpinus TaxID=1590643 RepID=A0ABW5TQN7_9SPHI